MEAPILAAPSLPRALSAAGIHRLELIGDFGAAEQKWRRLEETGVLSPYQRFDWLTAWQENIGAAEGIVPLLLTGVDKAGDPLFILPLGYGANERFKIVRFLGGKHANYNFGPWRRDFSAGPEVLRAVIDWLAEVKPELDGMELVNQPVGWSGHRNPFLALPRQQSPSDGYRLSLSGDETAAVSRVFTSSRKKRLRYRERKLVEISGYRYVRAVTPSEVGRYLDAFFAQKAERFARQGIENTFATTHVENFVRDLCLKGLDQGRPVIEIHALDTDEEPIAIFACVNDGERLSSMFNSFSQGAASRFSPGIVLLSYIIRSCIERRISVFDLGVGEAEYKTYFCDEMELLFDSYFGLSPRGQIVIAAFSAKAGFKRWIKRSPMLLKFALAVQRMRNGKLESGSEA